MDLISNAAIIQHSLLLPANGFYLHTVSTEGTSVKVYLVDHILYCLQ